MLDALVSIPALIAASWLRELLGLWTHERVSCDAHGSFAERVALSVQTSMPRPQRWFNIGHRICLSSVFRTVSI